MRVIGLTGGIGCGKSEVRRMLAEAGIKVLDADTLARDLTESNEGIVRAIKEEFGEGIYGPDGRLRRKELAAIVFDDRKKLDKLNAIIHPRVMSTVERELERLQEQGEEIAVVEAALHYEVNWNEAMDAMVVVSAPMEKRIAWLKQRDGVEEAAIRARMANQIPLEEKVAQADYVVENTGDREELRAAVRKLIDWMHERVSDV